MFTRIERGKNSQDYRLLSQTNWFDSSKNQSVLDLGCGSGLYTKYLSELGKNPIAFDLSKESIHLTKKYVGRKDLWTCCGTNVTLPFKDSTFDLVLCVETISHISRENQLTAFKEINRVIKANGVLILSVHNAFRFALQNIFRLKKPAMIYENPGLTIYPLTLSELRDGLNQAGFSPSVTIFTNFYNSIHQRYPKFFPILSLIENFLSYIPLFKRSSLTIMCKVEKIY